MACPLENWLPPDPLERLCANFLARRRNPDAEGFYTLWDAVSPDEVPSRVRRNPE